MADIAFLGTHELSQEDKRALLSTLSNKGFSVVPTISGTYPSGYSLVYVEEDQQFIFDNINPDDRVEVV